MPLAPITSYNTLVAAIQSFSEDIGGDLLEYLPVAVDNAENRLSRELDFIGQDYISTPVVLPPNTATFAKPTGHKATYFIEGRVVSTGETFVIEKKQNDYIVEYGSLASNVPKPKYYSDQNETTFTLAPKNSVDISVTVHGFRRPTPRLSVTDQTNIYTEIVPDCLFYATMLELAIWQRNDSLEAKFEALYAACRDSINNEGRRQRRDNGTPVANPEAGRNTLLGGQTNQ